MHSPTDSDANNIRKQLNQKYMLYLKRLCGVPSTTSHVVILPELNMQSTFDGNKPLQLGTP